MLNILKYSTESNEKLIYIQTDLSKIPGIQIGKSATEHDINMAQTKLGLKFSPWYVEFLLKYGTVTINHTEIYGIVGEPNSVVGTLDNRKYDKTLPPTHVLISDVGNGDGVYMDHKGEIFYRNHETKKDRPFAKNLDKWIEAILTY